MGDLIHHSTKILITGANGQLSQKLILYCLNHKIDFLATANLEKKFSKCPDEHFRIMDVTNNKQVKKIVEDYRPTHIINTAAMTNVDACEVEIEKCYTVNYLAVKHLLNVIESTTIHLIQISTDFIFDGEKKIYTEDDTPNPLGKYGKSKWKGEKVLLESKHNYITILRTSLVYGTGESLNKSNIFNWAMTQLREQKEIKIVDDQFRTPTYVEDLAQACFKAIDKRAFGIYNIAGSKLLSMYEYILLVADYLKVDKNLVCPTNSNQLNQKAPRPLSSGLNITKAKNELDYQPTDFMESLLRIDPLN